MPAFYKKNSSSNKESFSKNKLQLWSLTISNETFTVFLCNVEEALLRSAEHVKVTVVDIEPQRMEVHLIRL